MQHGTPANTATSPVYASAPAGSWRLHVKRQRRARSHAILVPTRSAHMAVQTVCPQTGSCTLLAFGTMIAQLIMQVPHTHVIKHTHGSLAPRHTLCRQTSSHRTGRAFFCTDRPVNIMRPSSALTSFSCASGAARTSVSITVRFASSASACVAPP